MSRIAFTPNASGTGTFSIASPGTNTDRTLTLPDATGTVLTDQSTVSAAQITGALNATGSAPIYACRAWVNFNGTGTVAIRASGNVSSITDNGTGNYTVNFATAMPDANYAVIGSVNTISGSVGIFTSVINSTDFDKTTTSVRVNSFNQAGSLFDTNSTNVAIFR
jgi:hypothetical protein